MALASAKRPELKLRKTAFLANSLRMAIARPAWADSKTVPRALLTRL